MKKLFVGQRVRIIYSLGWPELAGEVGTIIEASAYPYNHPRLAGKSCWIVAPDCWDGPTAPRYSVVGEYKAGRLGAADDQLEPASDANEMTSWDQCVWQPEHLEVKV